MTDCEGFTPVWNDDEGMWYCPACGEKIKYGLGTEVENERGEMGRIVGWYEDDYGRGTQVSVQFPEERFRISASKLKEYRPLNHL